MLDPQIPFKNRWLAGVLAFLLPGAGHIYQGRYFKGILCSICILGTFVIGMQLGDWKVVYWKRDPTNMLNPYYAQFFIGLPALPSLLQARRSSERTNTEASALGAPLDTPFRGTLKITDPSAGTPNGKLSGRIAVRSETSGADPGVRGEFTGTLVEPSGKEAEKKLALGGIPTIGKPVSSSPDRTFDIDVVDPGVDPPRTVGQIRGSISRSIWNWFEVPPDDAHYDELHRELGKYYELALTFTMIAGLLNILAILDAVEGPAYGYGRLGHKSEEKELGERRAPAPVPQPDGQKSPSGGAPARSAATANAPAIGKTS